MCVIRCLCVRSNAFAPLIHYVKLVSIKIGAIPIRWMWKNQFQCEVHCNFCASCDVPCEWPPKILNLVTIGISQSEYIGENRLNGASFHFSAEISASECVCVQVSVSLCTRSSHLLFDFMWWVLYALSQMLRQIESWRNVKSVACQLCSANLGQS